MDRILAKYLNGKGNGGVFNPLNLALYSYVYQSPLKLSDPDGNLPAAGILINPITQGPVGGAVGGGFQATTPKSSSTEFPADLGLNSSPPPSPAHQIANAIGGFVNGAIDGAKKFGELVINALSAPNINEGQQGKHVPGHNNFIPGKSELTHPDPQGLLNNGSGTGQPLNNEPVGEPGSRERVNFGENIGTHVDPQSGERTPTNTGIIHYGKGGAHIVPARPQPPQPPSE